MTLKIAKTMVLITVMLLMTITGFAQSKTITLEIAGMSCQKGCADGIDAKLNSINGIDSSKTSFAMGSSFIMYNPLVISEAEIVKIVTDKGFKTSIKASDKRSCSKDCIKKCCKKKTK